MKDRGNINQRILARMKRRDALRKLESAYREYPSTFYTPEIKRLFIRFYDITTLNVHYIEVIVRLREGGNNVAEKCEELLTSEIRRLLDDVDKSLDAAGALMQANGLTKEAEFLADSLTFNARVTSPIMRSYLRLMEKIDQLIRMLETLRIDGVLTTPHCESRRQVLKMHIKAFAGSARRLAQELRARDAEVASSAVKAKGAVAQDHTKLVIEGEARPPTAGETLNAADADDAPGERGQNGASSGGDNAKTARKANGSSKPSLTPAAV